MSKFTSSLAVAGTLLALCLSAAPVSAQRVFVSGSGNDSGNCSRAAPCRSFAYAIGQVPDHGEIAVLDTAGYGALTINQSVSIVNPGGVEAGVSVPPGGTAITITAGASDIVALRGLTIEGAQSGQTGISLTSGGTLEVDNCVVRDLTQNAVEIKPTTGTTVFRISNSIVAANGHDGVLVNPGSGTAQGVIDHVSASGNVNNGLSVAGGSGPTVKVSITNSVASGNTQAGIYVGVANVTVSASAASNNGSGIIAQTSGDVQITQTLVTGNTQGIYIIGGTVNTYSDNNINLNISNVTGGSLTPVGPQ